MSTLDSPSASLAGIAPLEPQAQDTQVQVQEHNEDVVMMNPPPSPPPPVAGAKREMVGVKAFALDNVKAPKLKSFDNVRPLARDMEQSHFTTAPKPASKRRVATLRSGNISSTPPIQSDFRFSMPQAAQQQQQQFAATSNAMLASQPFTPVGHHQGQNLGQNLLPFVTHGQGAYGQVPTTMNVVGINPANFMQVGPQFGTQVGPQFGTASFPVQGVPNQVYSVQMQGGYAVNNTALNAGLAPQPFNAGLAPQPFNAGLAPQLFNAGVAPPQPSNAGVTPQRSNAGHDSAKKETDLEQAKAIWQQLSSSEQEQLVRFYAASQQQLAASQPLSQGPSLSQRVEMSSSVEQRPPPNPPNPVSFSAQQPPPPPPNPVASSAYPESEGVSMHVDEELPALSSNLHKGKARESKGTPDLTQEDVNLMTNNFGLMVLNKIQDSHEQTQDLIADFMTKTTEMQTEFCETVVRQLKGAGGHSADPGSSPLRLHTHRRTPQNPAPRSSPSTPTPGKRAAGRRAARKSEVLAKKPEISDAVLLALQEAVRKHLQTLLGHKSWQDLVRRYPPLTEDEVEGYGLDDDSIPPPDVKFRIDFVHDWKRLPLNLAARDFFIQTLYGTIRGGGFGFDPEIVPLITETHVGDTLDGHMDYCRRKYREYYQPDGEHDDPAVEAQLKAQLKAQRKAKAEERKKRNAMGSRRGTLFDSRRFVLLNLGLSRHLVLLDAMLPQNMSGDELEDTKAATHRRYRIVEAQWMRTALRTFLRSLDGIYLEYCATRVGGGSGPRERVPYPTPKVEDSPAPDGLWRNCYDDAWLTSRPAHRLRKLRIINSNYDFSLHREFDEDATMSGDGSDEDEIEIESGL